MNFTLRVETRQVVNVLISIKNQNQVKYFATFSKNFLILTFQWLISELIPYQFDQFLSFINFTASFIQIPGKSLGEIIVIRGW